MMDIAIVLTYFHSEHYETLREYREGLDLMRSSEIKGKRELYEYH